MPIRLRGRTGRTGRITARLDDWTASLSGTYSLAPTYTGRIQAQMYDWTAAVSGVSLAASNVTGTIAATLDHWTASVTGWVDSPARWVDGQGDAFSVTVGVPFSYTFRAEDIDGDPISLSAVSYSADVSVTVNAQSGNERTVTVSGTLPAVGDYVADLNLDEGGSQIATLTVSSVNADASAPFMAGVAFARGAVASGVSLITSEPASSVVIKRRWNDGSAKHAVVVGQTSLTAGGSKSLTIAAGVRGGTNLTSASILAAAPSASVQLGLNGSVSLAPLLTSPFRTWISTPDMVECHYRASVNADLAVWFHVRLWANGRMWVRAIAENGYANGAPSTQTYTATVIIGGATVYSQTISHYAFTRWSVTGWIGTAATVRSSHVPAELIATHLVPNYWRRTPSSAKLNAQVQTYAPMQLSPQPVSMGDAGFGEYIGVIPNWSALFVTSADARAYDATLAASSAFNSYSICRRSSATNRLARPSDFPTFGLGSYSSTNALGTWEINHLVNEGYVAYLATGDYWHLETLGFNASYCYLTIASSNGQGVNRILRAETRGVGWMLNTVGHYCSIAPTEGEAAADVSVVTDYQSLLSNNLAYWSARIGDAGQNQLGSLYQYSLGAWSGTGSVAPWMTDFWVIVNGALSKMDPVASVSNWISVRDWMYRWIVGRFGPTGSDNFHFSRGGSEYGINISATNSTDPTTFYDSWGAVWSATFGSPNAETTNVLYSTNAGASNDPAYSERNHRWGVALAAFAYAIDDSATGASAAWARYTGASNWSAVEASNFSDIPVWGIVPRGYDGT